MNDNKNKMTFNNIFINPEFEKKYQNLKNSIEQYLLQKDYDLGELTIDEIIWWKDIDGTRIIEITEKCPSDINNVVTEMIKKEFPKAKN